MYAVTYDNEGRIGSIGSIDPGYAAEVPPEGVLYTTEIPEGPDILHRYKVQNGVFVYDPVPVEEPEDTPAAEGQELWALQQAQNDTDAMMVDQEYRLTLLELGV